jgi:radial spoke head protein 3
MDIQTDEYLEELSDRPIEVDADTQTDPLLDRPPSPKFVPKKSGVDTETQMYPREEMR